MIEIYSVCESEFDKTYNHANIIVKLNIVITLGVLVKQAEIEVITSGFLKPDLISISEGKWQSYYNF